MGVLSSFPFCFPSSICQPTLAQSPASTSFRFKFHLSRLWKADLKHDFVSNHSDLPNQHYYSEAQVEDKSCCMSWRLLSLFSASPSQDSRNYCTLVSKLLLPKPFNIPLPSADRPWEHSRDLIDDKHECRRAAEATGNVEARPFDPLH